MSLNWNVSKVANCEEVCYIVTDPENPEASKRLNPTTEGLIWATISVDLGEITEKNVDEFAYRLFFWEKAFGTLLNDKDGPVFLTYEDVKAHIGLVTNVSNQPRTKWSKRMKDSWFREASWAAQRAMEKAKKPNLMLVS